MSDKLHPVVELLVARMESHPEEFKFTRGGYHQRWYDHINSINEYGNEADKAAINAKMRDIRLAEVHEQVMDELLNGEDRRRKEQEEREYERELIIKKSGMAQAVGLAPGQYNQANAYRNQLGQLGSYQNAIGIGTQSPSQPLSIQSGGTEAMRIQTNGDIQIGNETLNEGLLKNIKKALKL